MMGRFRAVFVFFLTFFLLPFSALAMKIDKVIIEGNKRIPEGRILPYIMKAGDEFSEQALDESIKKLYGTKLFLDINCETFSDGSGFVLKYKLNEMPLVSSVEFSGNKEIKTKTLLEKMQIKKGQVLNFSSVEQALDAIRAVYENENRYGTKISFRIENKTANGVDVFFDITESGKSKIYNIRLYGNESISSSEIKDTMPTKERTFWSFISGSGKILKESLFMDRETIRMMYLERGYAQVAISEPDLRFHKDDSEKADMIVRIREGEQFFVRSIDIDGYENIPLERIKSQVGLRVGEVFNIKRYQEDIARITEVYTSSGYAYANVEPIISLDSEAKQVDIVYKIEENILVKIGRITISGNKSSFDNVIRRQIDQMEGALYNSILIREAKANAMATGFYENVQIKEKGNGGDVIDLDVNVTEQSTGTFTVGAAYSTVDGVMGMVQIARNNVFGLGHSTSLKAEVAEKRVDFSFSYTDPWFMDWPISLGGDLFNLKREWLEYTRTSEGGAIRIGHAIIKRRLFMNYRFSVYTVDINFDDYEDGKFSCDPGADNYDEYRCRQQGKTETRSISPAIIWNSLNNAVDPTRGNKSQIYLDFAGNFLGGDANFIKLGTETSQFIPIIDNDLILMLHGEIGYITPITPSESGEDIPLDERFRLGGINSVRGFNYGDISPKRMNKKGEEYAYGGDKYVQANAELIFPLKDDIKLKGVMFFDMGQVYSESEPLFSTDIRKSAGFGLRWMTPMGAFRLEWGYKLDRRDGESPSKFEFSIGGTF